MRVHFARWGNSLALRIPIAFAKLTRMRETPAYRLEDLIAGITDENRHDEVSTGRAVGAEFC